MAFCSYSNEIVDKGITNIDNVFFTHFLPFMNDSCVKVYLYGLYFCNKSVEYDNTLDHFAATLNISQDDVESVFFYLQDLGLVKVLNLSPIEIKYLPIKNAVGNKKINMGKYSDFAKSVQELISGRMISPSEYNEYFVFLDSMHVEPNALLMIVKYCTEIKGADVGHPYILTVAKNWAYSGIKTCEQVENKLLDSKLLDGELVEILKALSIRRAPSFDEREEFNKFKNTFGFDFETIYFVAKLLKFKGKSAFDSLSKKLLSYFQMGLLSKVEIENFENTKDNLKEIAIEINKAMGLYYENLDGIIETYISPFTQLGYSRETLIMLAKYALKAGIRSYEQFKLLIDKLYSAGIISEIALDQYLEQLKNENQTIKNILESLGLFRSVNDFDRKLYRTWINDWQISEELLLYAISISNNKINPMQYLNKVLSNIYTNKITSVDQAKKLNLDIKPSTTNKVKLIQPKNNVSTSSYSINDLSALFSDLKK